MPRLTDRQRIRSLLETDRPWGVYALADLETGFFEHANWFAGSDGQTLALFFSGFATPILITLGKAEALRSVLNELIDELNPRKLYAVVKPEVMPLLTDRFGIVEEREMQRMIFDPAQYRSVSSSSAVALGLFDLESVQRLYADGESSDEAPEWFLPQMLRQETYHGIRESDELVAVAGTHIVSVNEKVAALGNIYTRRDRRRRGLSTQATSAVLAKLMTMDLPTIVLNVRANNAAAIRVYERIGFRNYCDYIEAPLIRRE